MSERQFADYVAPDYRHVGGVMGYECSRCGFKAKGPVWVMLPVMRGHDEIHADGSIDGD